jgi:hypothetical protein
VGGTQVENVSVVCASVDALGAASAVPIAAASAILRRLIMHSSFEALV